jgi:menaquinone-dependent protoporphyrinogen oxidase
MNVLVAYATKNGSTQQVAEAIAAALRERDAQVVILPARSVREPVTGYDLVVLGAPLYSGRWHRDAHRFLRRHRRQLPSVPLAVFGMGPRSDTEDAWQRSRAQLDRALAKRDGLAPIAVTVFGGVDPPGPSKHPRRDLRNWETIQAWGTQALVTADTTRKDPRTAGQ